MSGQPITDSLPGIIVQDRPVRHWVKQDIFNERSIAEGRVVNTVFTFSAG